MSEIKFNRHRCSLNSTKNQLGITEQKLYCEISRTEITETVAKNHNFTAAVVYLEQPAAVSIGVKNLVEIHVRICGNITSLCLSNLPSNF